MAVLARLSTILDANTSRFEEGMKRSRKSMRSFSSVVKKGTKTAAVAVGVLGSALTALTIRQLKVIDETAKLSAALGVSVKDFQALALVASEAAINQDQLGNIVTKLQKAVIEADRGMATYKRSFDTLGISTKDLLKLDPAQQFEMVAKALAKVENPTLRTATALEIFGRSGRQVNNMLVNFEKNVEDARKFNEKFNLSLSDVDASKIEEANDKFARAKTAISGLGNTLAVEFAPIITAISQSFIDGGLDAETFGAGVSRGMAIAATAIDIVIRSMQGVKLIVANMSFTIDKFVLNTTKSLFNLATAAEKIPGLAEKMAGVKDELLFLNQAAQDTGLASQKRIEDLKKEIQDFVPLAERLKKIQAEAQERAEKTAAAKAELGNVSGDITEFENFSKSVDGASKKQLDYNVLVKDSFKDVVSSFGKGERAADSFKRVTLNAISKIADSVISNLSDNLFSNLFKGGGGKSGSAGGGILSGLVGSAVSGIGGFFKGLLPSFAVGSFNVPSDMVANIHKGEMIIPAREAEQIRAGGNNGGGVSIVQNIRIGDNVTSAVRQELSKAMPELKRASVEAVKDARLRGADI